MDITNQKFGRLTVIERAEKNRHGQARWRCICECGNEVITEQSSLISGKTKSCGCLTRDHAKHLRPIIHGSTRTRLYRVWNNMRNRCTNPKNPSYCNYGARGISVCKEWDDFSIFKEWALANGYSSDLTLDRIDNNGNYCPSNCRWVSHLIQGNNKRNNILYVYENQKYTLGDLARQFGIPYKTLWARINSSGWDLEKAITTPVDISIRHKKEINHD